MTIIEQIKAEIERLEHENCMNGGEHFCMRRAICLGNLHNIINPLYHEKQEQPEDIVVIAKTFLDALSKTPYNNKPITDAQIIVKQLLLFFENPKEYNPDAILE